MFQITFIVSHPPTRHCYEELSPAFSVTSLQTLGGALPGPSRSHIFPWVSHPCPSTSTYGTGSPVPATLGPPLNSLQISFTYQRTQNECNRHIRAKEWWVERDAPFHWPTGHVCTHRGWMSLASITARTRWLGAHAQLLAHHTPRPFPSDTREIKWKFWIDIDSVSF